MLSIKSDREIELLDKIAPWLIMSMKDGEPAKLKPDAPEDIKAAYEEWLKL